MLANRQRVVGVVHEVLRVPHIRLCESRKRTLSSLGCVLVLATVMVTVFAITPAFVTMPVSVVAPIVARRKTRRRKTEDLWCMGSMHRGPRRAAAQVRRAARMPQGTLRRERLRLHLLEMLVQMAVSRRTRPVHRRHGR